MGFEKGRAKTGGIEKGTKQNKTLEWEEFGRQLLEGGMPRVLAIMNSGEDKEFLDMFTNILEYFKPKLSRVESSGTSTVTVNVTSLPDSDLEKLAE